MDGLIQPPISQEKYSIFLIFLQMLQIFLLYTSMMSVTRAQVRGFQLAAKKSVTLLLSTLNLWSTRIINTACNYAMRIIIRCQFRLNWFRVRKLFRRMVGLAARS